MTFPHFMGWFSTNQLTSIFLLLHIIAPPSPKVAYTCQIWILFYEYIFELLCVQAYIYNIMYIYIYTYIQLGYHSIYRKQSHGHNMACFPILGNARQFLDRDLYTQYREPLIHDGGITMPHIHPYSMFWPWLISFEKYPAVLFHQTC